MYIQVSASILQIVGMDKYEQESSETASTDYLHYFGTETNQRLYCCHMTTMGWLSYGETQNTGGIGTVYKLNSQCNVILRSIMYHILLGFLVLLYIQLFASILQIVGMDKWIVNTIYLKAINGPARDFIGTYEMR